MDNLTKTQKDVAEYFESYPYIEKKENFKFDSNTPYAIINLKQSDFNNGTVRITKPGIYILTESITFNPNESNDFSPTTEQISSGLYPQNMSGPYHLGFFAAITIETDDVLIDLQMHTIQQSKLHNFQQRFYANIELANMPFIPSQGPGNFAGAMQYQSANRLLIQNGYLGLSSHHGIHGNVSNKTILSKLNISQFEVAGIAINGTTTGILSDILVHNIKHTIPVLSTYSSARFIRKFLEAHITSNKTLNGKTVNDILTSIKNDLDVTFNAFKNGQPLPNNYLKNPKPDKGYDGNVYGIVLNVKGVVVNNFITDRTADMIGNIDIHLDSVVINGISSRPVEIIGLNAVPSTEVAYGGKVQVGPVGDILQIANIQSNDKYVGNNLSDGKLILALISQSPKGTTNITNPIVEWATNNTDISTVLSDNSMYYVSGGDSMGHFMKGNLGLFVSGGYKITGKAISISGVISKGNDVGVTTLTPIKPPLSKSGSRAASLLFTGSSNIFFYDTKNKLGKAVSENGGQVGNILYINTNSNISVL